MSRVGDQSVRAGKSCTTRRSWILLLVAVAGLWSFSVTRALASPSYEGLFEYPSSDPPTTIKIEIRDRVIELIDSAAAGSHIRASMYMIPPYCDGAPYAGGAVYKPCASDRLMGALERAIVDRGVTFWINYDGEKDNNAEFAIELNRRLTNAGAAHRFFHEACFGSCIRNDDRGHSTHNKHWMFSSVNVVTVILESSEIFTWGQFREHQQAVLIHDDLTLYYGYVRDFENQLCASLETKANKGRLAAFSASKCTPFDPNRVYAHRTRTSGTTLAHFMPVINNDDVIVQMLSRVVPTALATLGWPAACLTQCVRPSLVDW